MQYAIKYSLAGLLLLLAGCIKKDAAPFQPIDASSASLRDVLANNFSFSLFYEAMRKTGTDTLLDNEKEGYTLFAPDNGAFSRSGITPDSLQRINIEVLRKTVLYHVVPGKISSTAIPQALNYSFATLEKDLLYTSATSLDTNLYVNGLTVIKKNIRARNGVVHAVENVLTLPVSSVQEILAKDPEFSVLVAGFKKFGLWDQLANSKPIVVLAPTNTAFADHNWNEAAINDMNPAEFKKFVFGTYVLSPAFFFLRDLHIAPPKGPFLQDDVLLLFQRSGPVDIEAKVLPYNYRDSENSTRNIYYGDWVRYPNDRPGQLAINGIVHIADQLPVIPDSARIK